MEKSNFGLGTYRVKGVNSERFFLTDQEEDNTKLNSDDMYGHSQKKATVREATLMDDVKVGSTSKSDGCFFLLIRSMIINKTHDPHILPA